ncbi:ANR60 protein, partial [Bucorvus abyssinicus]|nr:ANR60 protein [Bucorvus abyssinicus]
TAMSSSAPQSFSVQLHLAETNEIFSLPQSQNDLTLKKLKSHLELLTGIPLHLQRLQYLDEADLPDESTFQDNNIVPGGTITMHIWRQDGWGRLVAAAAKGETLKVNSITSVNGTFAGSTPHAELLGPEQRKEWIAHRAFVALFVASCRGHIETVEFLLRHGVDLHTQTPLGRTTLHITAVAGRCYCLELLLNYGAQALGPDSEGQTGLSLACQWGQKQSERTMVCLQWRKRSPGTVPPPSAAGRALQQPS